MGAYSPASLDKNLWERVKTEILFPAVGTAGGRVIYRGVLYAGLITASGPKVLEYNVVSAIGMPGHTARLSDLAEIMLAVIDGKLKQSAGMTTTQPVW